MKDTSDSTKAAGTARDPQLGRLAAMGAVAATAAVTAYLRRPTRNQDAESRKHHALIVYLREHLSGSDVAMRVVSRLGADLHGQDELLFRRLAKEFEEDRAVVRSLLTQLGASQRSLKRVAGYASGSMLSMTAGGQPGDLALLRTLEGLAIGVQGKRCLWRALQRLGTAPPAGGLSFTALESKAVRQWEAIERRRRDVTAETFPALP
jgi:hypothetical protein